MIRTLTPVVMDAATGWDGRIISPQMARYLTVGCIVRVVVSNVNGVSEAIYFQITKLKNGTIWGCVQDTYRLRDFVRLPNGSSMSFKKVHINEIPLEWQPKQYRKAVRHLATRTKEYGYSPTGVRDIAL